MPQLSQKKYKTKDKTTNNETDYVDKPDRSTEDGETHEGDAHTHPYGKKEGSLLGIAFSAEDLMGLYDDSNTTGFFTMIEAGNERFALVITNRDKALSRLVEMNDEQLREVYNTAKNNALKNGKDERLSTIAAVLAVIGPEATSGIGFYHTIDPQKQKFEQLK